jgi:hypothetical protein
MKRRQLLKHLRAHNCEILREGGRHSWWHNPLLNKRSAIPRHTPKSLTCWPTRFAKTWGYRKLKNKNNCPVVASACPFSATTSSAACRSGSGTVCGGAHRYDPNLWFVNSPKPNQTPTHQQSLHRAHKPKRNPKPSPAICNHSKKSKRKNIRHHLRHLDHIIINHQPTPPRNIPTNPKNLMNSINSTNPITQQTQRTQQTQ